MSEAPSYWTSAGLSQSQWDAVDNLPGGRTLGFEQPIPTSAYPSAEPFVAIYNAAYPNADLANAANVSGYGSNDPSFMGISDVTNNASSITPMPLDQTSSGLSFNEPSQEYILPPKADIGAYGSEFSGAGSSEASVTGPDGGSVASTPSAVGVLPGPAGQMGLGGNPGGMLSQLGGMVPGPAGAALSSIGKGSLGAFGSGSQGGAGTPQTGGDTGPGAPILITDISAAGGKGAGPQVQKGLEKAGEDLIKAEAHATSGLTADTASLTGTATGLAQYAGNLLYNTLPRIVAGLGAVVLIGLGIWLIGKNPPNMAVT